MGSLASENPVTLGPSSKAKKLLWVYCCDCCHERDVDPASLPLSWNTPVPLIGTHMKCSACGGRKINAKPELYPGGVAAMRGREIDKGSHERRRSTLPVCPADISSSP